MNADCSAVVSNMVHESAVELVADTEGMSAYQVFRQDPDGSFDEATPVDVAAVIGFSGDLIKGSLVITTGMDLLNKSHPNHAMGMPVADPDCLDWIGEIANQLLGRIKNKMAAAGVPFSMSTPTTAVGKSLKISKPKSGAAFGITFNGPYNPLSLHFLYVADPAIAFKETKSESSAKEGASLLF